jgi:hypothetical protein
MMFVQMNDDLALIVKLALEAMFASTESAVTNRHAAEPD